MSKDGLRPLPAHVTATLLRALMTIPVTRHDKLILRRVSEPRRPAYSLDDYDVLWRGQKVGRIDLDRNPYPAERGVSWRWFMSDPNGGTGSVSDMKTRRASGRAATLDAAMAEFRRAWDATTGDIGRSCG